MHGLQWPIHSAQAKLLARLGLGSPAAEIEYHRRHFVLMPNQLEYYRMLMQATAGTKSVLLLSQVASVEVRAFNLYVNLSHAWFLNYG